MSLNFSRRTFFRLIPMAALAVASAGVLTACDDPNKPTGKFGATLSPASVQTTVKKTSNEEYEVTLKNGSDNAISVDPNRFWVRVTSSDKNYIDYPATSVDPVNYTLAKGKSMTTTVTCEGVTVSDDDTLAFYYCPREYYAGVTYASWS